MGGGEYDQVIHFHVAIQNHIRKAKGFASFLTIESTHLCERTDRAAVDAKGHICRFGWGFGEYVDLRHFGGVRSYFATDESLTWDVADGRAGTTFVAELEVLSVDLYGFCTRSNY